MSLDDLDARTSHLQANAIEHSSSLNYGTGARDYIAFCLNHHLSIDPTPQTLSRYVAFTSQFIASGPKYLTGARHFLQHIYPDFETNHSHPLVQSTIRGAKKLRADPVRRKLPLRAQHLQFFYQRWLSSQKYDNLLFITILSCCFYALHRSGELLVPNSRILRDFRKLIKHDTLHFSAGRVGYRLPYHKGDPFFAGTDILHTTQDIANPVYLLHTYTILRDKTHGIKAPLFIRENGSLPTRGWFETKFRSILGREYGLHSAQAGGTTFLQD